MDFFNAIWNNFLNNLSCFMLNFACAYLTFCESQLRRRTIDHELFKDILNESAELEVICNISCYKWFMLFTVYSICLRLCVLKTISKRKTMSGWVEWFKLSSWYVLLLFSFSSKMDRCLLILLDSLIKYYQRKLKIRYFIYFWEIWIDR